MGRDKLTLVGAGCVLTVHSSWNTGAQEEKKKVGGFLFFGVGFFLLGCLVLLLLFFLSLSHFLMGQQANPM